MARGLKSRIKISILGSLAISIFLNHSFAVELKTELLEQVLSSCSCGYQNSYRLKDKFWGELRCDCPGYEIDNIFVACKLPGTPKPMDCLKDPSLVIQKDTNKIKIKKNEGQDVKKSKQDV